MAPPAIVLGYSQPANFLFKIPFHFLCLTAVPDVGVWILSKPRNSRIGSQIKGRYVRISLFPAKLSFTGEHWASLSHESAKKGTIAF